MAKPAKAMPHNNKKDKHRPQRSLLIPAVGGILAAWCGISIGHCISRVHRHGIFGLPFVDRTWFDLQYNATEWDAIVSDKRLLFIGGPHRGGTTVLWECIAAHPEVSGFGNSWLTGADYSEGILMQDVYPSFGIGEELGMDLSDNRGLGRYALDPDVHLTQNSPLVTPENKARLLNRFGRFWDLSMTVLVEKSPPNAVISTFLQTLMDSKKTKIDTRFIFITRHPIANAYAHMRVDSSLTLLTLMENYLQLHSYLTEDLPKLRNNPMLLKLEDFVEAPKDHLKRIFEWLQIDSSDEIIHTILANMPIRKGVNDRYKEVWCTTESQYPQQAHQWQKALDALSLQYNIVDWCNES